MSQDYLFREHAAAHVRQRGLPCTKATLGKLATTGGGPRYRRFGNRAVYTIKDLDEWIEAKLTAPRTSTSGKAAA